METTYELRVVMTRYISGGQPGRVECRLTDAFGCEWLFVDKVPIFCADYDFDSDTCFPKRGVIRCQIVKRWQDAGGQDVVTVSTELPDHVESNTGETEFDVRPEQVDSTDRE